MDYAITVSDTTKRWLAKADSEMRRRFWKKVELLRIGPEVYGKPLRGPLAGIWERRLEGSFRITYSINQENRTVVIEAVKHKDEFR